MSVVFIILCTWRLASPARGKKRYVLSPSLLPRLGAVAVTVTTTPRLIGSVGSRPVSGVVWGDACVPGFGCGLARESVGAGWGSASLLSVCLLAFACLLAWSRSESRWGERGAGP